MPVIIFNKISFYYIPDSGSILTGLFLQFSQHLRVMYNSYSTIVKVILELDI